jgi:hypothetical protein
MTKSCSLVLAVLVMLVVGLGSTLQPQTAHASNGYDFYRWPWRYNSTYQMTQAWNGAASHFSATGLYYAIDIGFNAQVMAAEEGSATCAFVEDTFGYRVRVTHGSDSSMYAHLDPCGFSGPTNVVQGYQVGDSGCTGTCDGTHLHFQVNTTTSSTISKAFSMSGVTPPNNGGSNCPCNYYTSDNNSAGYDTGLSFYSAVHTGYVNFGGWGTVGSSASLSGWSPCQSTVTPAVYGCSSGSYSGLVQTFKGPSGKLQAIMSATGYSTGYLLLNGFLGSYTDVWSGSLDGVYFMGYPTGNAFVAGGYIYQYFQAGYGVYNTSTCLTQYFVGGYEVYQTASYCN